MFLYWLAFDMFWPCYGSPPGIIPNIIETHCAIVSITIHRHTHLNCLITIRYFVYKEYTSLKITMQLSEYPRPRENKENGPKSSLSMKTQGIWKCCQKEREFCQNTGRTGNFVCSSCTCSYSKSKGFCDICRKKNCIRTGKTQGIWKYKLSGYSEL